MCYLSFLTHMYVGENALFFSRKLKKIELVKPANEQAGASGIISRGVGVKKNDKKFE